jgi:hypothetical protein
MKEAAITRRSLRRRILRVAIIPDRFPVALSEVTVVSENAFILLLFAA